VERKVVRGEEFDERVDIAGPVELDERDRRHHGNLGDRLRHPVGRALGGGCTVRDDRADVQLLERHDALARLEGALDRVRRTGAGEVATVRGEAGVGKTSLVSALTSTVSNTDILWGACEGLRTPRPLAPILDIARSMGPGGDRERLFASVLDRLATAKHPVVVVIEDAHWADDATLDFLTILGRRAAGTRALLTITYRDDEVGAHHPLRVVLGDVSAATRERIRLLPLSLQAVTTLSAGHDVDPHSLHAVTGGNPFYVTESLAAGTSGVPDSVRDAVLARAARLGPAGRRALEAVAVVPGRAELWLVDMVAGADAAALDECVEGGVVELSGDHAAMRHELARLAVDGAIAPVRRRGLHRRVLAALADPPTGAPDAARLAYHAAEAGDIDAVVTYAPVAAERASANGAHREAAAHLRDALVHADRFPLEEQGRLHGQHGIELGLINRIDEAVAAFDAAIACWRELGDVPAEGRTLLRLTSPLVAAGRQPEAIETVRRAIELLEPLGPGPELADAYVSSASLAMLDRRLPTAIEESFRGEALAAELGEGVVVCTARIQGGIAQLMAGDDNGLARINAGIELARTIGADSRVALGLSQIGSGAGEVRRYDVAIPALLEGRRFAYDHEVVGSERYMTAWLGRCDLDQGRWDDAARWSTEVVAGHGTVDIATFTALTTIGRLRARRGDPDVWSPLDRALDLARRTGHLQRLWPVAAARAEAAWLAGRLDDAVEHVEVVDLVAEVFELADELDYPWAIGELAFWLWRAGRLDAPPAVAAEPFRLHIAGRFEDAADAWRGLGCPYEEASALADSDDASSVRAALDIYATLGARPAALRTTHRLRSMGVRVARGPNIAARGHPAGMTDREIEVLVLVAAGLTNRALAERLDISVKTAGHHVSSILAKLGVATRAEAAVAAVRMGIARSQT
jgi:DNA-binding CsgD family transcriptional regulator/tetratricopeptide (TPR) repeat protein